MIGAVMPAVAGLVAPAGQRGRLSILIFHRVLPQPDPLFPEVPDAALFERQMRWVARWFHVVALPDAVRRLREGTLPARALAITFDDGYADNATVAVPILRRLGLSATFFVTTGAVDGGRMWNDTVIEAIRRAPEGTLDLQTEGLGRYPLGDWASRRTAIDAVLAAIKRWPYGERQALVARIASAAKAALPDDLMMTAAQVRGLLAAGMSVGGHTVTHPILSRLDDAQAEREIADGKSGLERISGGAVELFAYPNGVPGVDYEARHVEMVRRCGFCAAFTTAPGVAVRGADPFQLPRFTPWDRSAGRFALRMLDNLRRTQPAIV